MTNPADIARDDLAPRVARGRLGKPFSRRLFLAGTTAGAAALGLTACGGSATTDAPTADGSGGFPITLKGKEGTATIPAEPRRVITLGFQRDTDTALALGVTPVAMVENAAFLSLIAPWVEAKLAGSKPEVLSITDGMPFEKIASLRPDVILATDSYELTDNYRRLTQIAPTVSYLDGPDADTWQQRTTLIGKALGRAEQAQQLVTDIETRVKQAAQDHPAFAGKTFSFSAVASREVQTVLPGDAAAIFLEQLGLKISPEVAAQPESSIPGRAMVSLENLGILNADVMIVAYITEDDRTFLESNRVFQQLDTVKNGNYVALDLPVAIALGFPSALATPYALDKSVPAVARALE